MKHMLSLEVIVSILAAILISWAALGFLHRADPPKHRTHDAYGGISPLR